MKTLARTIATVVFCVFLFDVSNRVARVFFGALPHLIGVPLTLLTIFAAVMTINETAAIIERRLLYLRTMWMIRRAWRRTGRDAD